MAEGGGGCTKSTIHPPAKSQGRIKGGASWAQTARVVMRVTGRHGTC